MIDVPESHRDLLDAQVATFADAAADGNLIPARGRRAEALLQQGPREDAQRAGAVTAAEYDASGETRIVFTITPTRVHVVDMSG
jgi:hypothetical protein